MEARRYVRVEPVQYTKIHAEVSERGRLSSIAEIDIVAEAAGKIETGEVALTNELFNLYDYYEVRLELLNVANENLDAAELNPSISEEKYRSGVINSFNYRDIQLIYMSVSYQRLQAVYNLISSRAGLTRITGGFLGYEEE